MGLNKPITVSGGLTAAEVQSIIDAQTTAISVKVDAQTNTLKTDIPSSISGGASVSEIKAALDEKLQQYSGGKVVKSKQLGFFTSNKDGSDKTVAINTINASKAHITFYCENRSRYRIAGESDWLSAKLKSMTNNSFTIVDGNYNGWSEGYNEQGTQTIYYEIIEFY